MSVFNGASGPAAAAAMGPMLWDPKDGRLSRNDMFPMAALLKVAKVVIFLKQDKGSTVKVQPWGSKSTIKIIGSTLEKTILLAGSFAINNAGLSGLSLITPCQRRSRRCSIDLR